MTSLTAKQQQAYDYIRAFYAEHSVGPTVREVGAHLGVKSSCSSQRHIEALIRKGFVTHDRYKYRSLRPVEALPVAADEIEVENASLRMAFKSALRIIDTYGHCAARNPYPALREDYATIEAARHTATGGPRQC